MIRIKALTLRSETDMLYMNSVRHNEILKAITDKAKSIVPQNSEVILFGSQARGDAREDSDWDILIVLPKTKLEQVDYDTVSYPFVELGWKIGEQINPIMYTQKEWAVNSITPFYENVMKDGINLI